MSPLVTRTTWTALMVAFAALNVWALAVDGLDGLVAYLTTLSPIGMLATVDLLLALLVSLTLITRVARLQAVDARPYVALTLATGSLGLLAYLARHDVSARPVTTAHDTPAHPVTG
jgi:hypothetical protein